MSGEYDVFVGPCSHGRDPWDRCEICGEGTALEAAVALIEKLQQEIVILKNPRVTNEDFSVLADLWQKQAEQAFNEIKNLRKALKIVVSDYENGLLCCEANGNTEEVVRICREALAGKEVTGL